MDACWVIFGEPINLFSGYSLTLWCVYPHGISAVLCIPGISSFWLGWGCVKTLPAAFSACLAKPEAAGSSCPLEPFPAGFPISQSWGLELNLHRTKLSASVMPSRHLRTHQLPSAAHYHFSTCIKQPALPLWGFLRCFWCLQGCHQYGLGRAGASVPAGGAFPSSAALPLLPWRCPARAHPRAPSPWKLTGPGWGCWAGSGPALGAPAARAKLSLQR